MKTPTPVQQRTTSKSDSAAKKSQIKAAEEANLTVIKAGSKSESLPLKANDTAREMANRA